jgi:hypothetical protein
VEKEARGRSPARSRSQPGALQAPQRAEQQAALKAPSKVAAPALSCASAGLPSEKLGSCRSHASQPAAQPSPLLPAAGRRHPQRLPLAVQAARQEHLARARPPGRPAPLPAGRRAAA